MQSGVLSGHVVESEVSKVRHRPATLPMPREIPAELGWNIVKDKSDDKKGRERSHC
jgi:hypothetical protein